MIPVHSTRRHLLRPRDYSWQFPSSLHFFRLAVRPRLIRSSHSDASDRPSFNVCGWGALRANPRSFWEGSWRRVYAGKLEVRPPGAPTTEPDSGKITCPAVDKHFATREELSSARTLFFRVGLPVHQQRVGAAALSSSVLMRNRPAGATSYLPALLRVAAA